MIPSDATQLLPRIVQDDPRIHLLDDIWLLTVFAILLAVGLPWLFGGVEYDVGAAMLILLALGSIHLILAALVASGEAIDLPRRRLLTLLHLGGVVLMGVIWQHAGSLQNPALLGAFVLPVIGAVFLSRWHSYLTAVVAIAVVVAVALIQLPELRWYAGGMRWGGEWIARVFGREGAAGAAPFAAFYAPARYFVAVIEVFGILLLAIAAAAEYLGTIFERLHRSARVAAAEAQRGQELWATLIEQLPLLALLVESETTLVICSSQSATARFGMIEGRPLFEAIRFATPEVIQELVSGDDGTVVNNVLNSGDGWLVATVRVQHVAQRGRRFSLLVFEDDTEVFGIKAALDAADHASLVIDSRGQVMAFNKPAAGLFSGLAVGDLAGDLLGPTAGAGWWEPGIGGRRKLHVTLHPRIYQVTCSAVLLPATNERLVVVALLPVARSADDQQQMAETTLVMPGLVRTR